MYPSKSIPRSREETRHERITQWLILGLLLIRILEGVMELIAYPSMMGWLASMNFIYSVSTYLLTAFLIWWERESLPDFHIGQLALILFILSKPYQLILELLGLAPCSRIMLLILVPASIWLFWALRKDEKQVFKNPANLTRWIVASLPVGVILGLLSGFILILQGGQGGRQPTLLLLFIAPTIQLTNAAVNEEPLFRGFLWGFLGKRGLGNAWIWMIQAGLFWLGHIGYLGQIGMHLSFWMALIMGLIFGLIAWRAQDIAPSMITHALVNGIGQIVSGY